MAVKYWHVAGNGSANWSTAANWYNGSGGTGGVTTAPTSADDVIFDAASGNGTVNITTASTCSSLDATNFGGTIAGTSALNITNTTANRTSISAPLFALGTGTTLNYTGTITFGGSGNGVGGWIFCNGKTFRGAVTFNNAVAGATFTLKDTFRTLVGGAGLLVTLTNGNLIAEADFIIGRFSSGTGVKSITCSNLYLTGTGTLSTTSSALTSTIGNIYVTDNSVTAKTLTFNTIFGSANVEFGGTSSGGLTFVPGVTFQPNVLVSNTGGAIFNISTAGTIKNLIFSETSNVNWNNAAIIVTSNGSLFTMVSGITVTNTPSLIFTGPSTITTAGKNLVTGALTTNGATGIVGVFSSNAAVTINGTIADNVNFDSTFLTTGTLTVAGAKCVFTRTLTAGAITMNANGIHLGTIEVYENVICTGLTTISGGGTIYYNRTFTSSAITLNFGSILATGSLDEDQTLTCTNVLTLVRGSFDNSSSYQGSPMYIGSIVVSGTATKIIYTVYDLYLTGTGTLFTPGTATNLVVSIPNIYVTNNTVTAKTLSFTNTFGSPYVYLRGSGTITFGAGTASTPIVTVQGTGGAVVSFLTGSIYYLIFESGTNATWNNAASQTITIGGALTLTPSMSISTLTPSLYFVTLDGNEMNMTTAGKAFIGGSLTIESSTLNILDDFNANIPVIVAGGQLNTKGFLTTGLVTVTGSAYLYTTTSAFSAGSLLLLDGYITFNAPTHTVTGAVTVNSGTNSISGNDISIGGTLTVSGGSSLDMYSALTVTGLTTISGGSTMTLYSTNIFSALTITSGALYTGGGVEYVCTGVTSLIEGEFGNGGIYTTGTLSTSGGAATKDIGTSRLYFTGSGTLYSQATGVVLSTGPDEIHVVGSSALAKTLTLGTQFPYNTNTPVYLGGSGSGSISLTPGSASFPNIYVNNTGGANISIGSGIINDLFFYNISNAVWNNTAVTLQVQGAVTFSPASSATIVATPTISFNSGASNSISLYGRTLTAPVSITLTSYVAVMTNFNTISTVTVTDGTLDVFSSNFSAPTLTTGTNGSTLIRNCNVSLNTLSTAGAYSQLAGYLTVSGTIAVTGQFTTSGNVVITCTVAFTGTGSNLLVSLSSATTVNLIGSGTVWSVATNANVTVNGIIKITDISNGAVLFAGGGYSYYDLIFDRADSFGSNNISGSNYFTNLRDFGTSAHSLVFPSSAITTLGNLDVHGTPENRIQITRSSTTTATLSKSPAGLVTLDYVDVLNVPATPDNTWYAGPNSTVTNSANWVAGGRVRRQSALGVG